MFSIITATYNRAYCVGDAIQSILDQEFEDWELIVVDDGSTDNTREVVNNFSDPRIKYVYLSQNQGVNVARNRGVQVATKEWIMSLDSDNIFAKNAFHTIAAAIGKYNPSFLRFPNKDRKGKYSVANPTYRGFVNYIDVLGGKMGGEYHSVIRVDIMKRYPFFEDIVGGEGITWLLIMKDLGGVFFVPEVVLIYNNELPDRLSNVWRNIPRIRKVYKKELDVLGDEYRQHYPFQYIKRRVKYFLYCVVGAVIQLYKRKL